MSYLSPEPGATGREPEPTDSWEAQAGAGADSAIDPRALLATIRRRIWLVIGVSLAIFSIVAATALRVPPTYRATAFIRLKDVRGALTGEAGSAALLQGLFGPQTDPVLSELQPLTSRAVAGEVVDREGLRLEVADGDLRRGALSEVLVPEGAREDSFTVRFTARGVIAPGARAPVPYGSPVQVNGIRFTVAEQPGVDDAILAVVPRRAAVDEVLSGLEAAPRELTDGVNVSYSAGDPVLAQRVTNALVEVFQGFNARSAQQQARRRRVFLEEQIAATDSLLRRAQTELSGFRRQQEVYSSGQRLTAEQATLTDLGTRRNALASELSMYRSLLAALERGGSQRDAALAGIMAAPEVAANAAISQLYTQLIRYQTTRDSMTAGHWSRSATDPDVQRYDQLIASTRARLLEAARSHVSVVSARVAGLDDLRGRTAAGLRALPDAEAREVRLGMQVDALRNISDQLQEQYQRARGAEVVEAGTVEIIDMAEVPLKPEPRRRAIKLLLGMMMAGGLGLAAAFLREYLQSGLVRREELEEATGLPVLAVVPGELPEGAGRRLRLPGRRPGMEERPPPVVLHAPRSRAAEAYRLLRVNLMFSQALHALRTIVVSSGAPGEGKSTTAANLAAAYARQGMRTLLVDGDLRKPAAHEIFGIPREPGLTQFVLDLEPLEAVMRPTGVEGLTLLPAGALPPNPTEFLASAAFRRRLEELAERFEVVVIDTPPVLLAADAAVLGGMADQVVVVARAGTTDRASLRRTIQQIRAVGGQVAGVVLNDPDVVVPGYATDAADRYTDYAYGYGYTEPR
jgi:polysaccharide biosynthesis transport protein